MSSKDDLEKAQRLKTEIEDLQQRLTAAQTQLAAVSIPDETKLNSDTVISSKGPLLPSPTHFLLLLADSALPLGSFAFSSGLESYLAHTPRGAASFSAFLSLSLASYASTTLPFVLAAYRRPQDLIILDDALDAALMCTVGRRASVAQGRALLSIWDRSFKSSISSLLSSSTPLAKDGIAILAEFSALLRSPSTAADDLPPASAHLGPLFGAIARVSGLSPQDTAYVFMLSHVKALVSAAVRASLFGPFQAQKVIASWEVQEKIREAIEKEWNTKWQDVGQSVPVMDLWIGRHELLYSRIFNS